MSFYAQKILEKSDEKGMFHFQNFAIDLKYCLSSFVEPEFDGSDIDTFENAVELRSIMIHEYQHFLDATHTVWGIDYLFDLEHAYSHFDDIERLQNESQFIVLMQIYEKLNSIVLPSYYKLNFYNKDNKLEKDLLKVEPTIGNIFNKYGEVNYNNPCSFVNFYQKGQRLLRSPISIIALLECSAVLEEICYRYGAILSELQDHDLHRIISERKLKKHIDDLIYNPDLSEYSCLFLLLSNKVKNFKILENFIISKMLINICLNFTSEHFSILLSSQFMFYLESKCNPHIDGGDFFRKLSLGLKTEDRGMLFLAFYCLLPDDRELKNPKECISIINTILNSIRDDLDYDILLSEARKYIERTSSTLEGTSVSYISKVAKSIKYNLNIIYGLEDDSNEFIKNIFNGPKLSLMDLPTCTMDDMNTIGLYTGEEDMTDPKWNLKFSDIDCIEQDINDLSERFLKIEKFVEACIS